MDEATPEHAPHKKNDGMGATLSIIVLVILFILGGLYFAWQENKRLHTPPIEQTINV